MNAAKIALALALTPVAVGMMTVTGCSSQPATPVQKENMVDAGSTKLKALEREYPDLQPLIEKSVGYVIFPSVGAGGLVISAAGGKGTVYEQGKFIGTASLTRVNIGLTAGGEDFAELLIFKDQNAFNNFKGNPLKFDAAASAIALKDGAFAAPDFSKGYAVFTAGNSGLMADASVGGQELRFTADPSMAPMSGSGSSSMPSQPPMQSQQSMPMAPATTGPSMPGM